MGVHKRPGPCRFEFIAIGIIDSMILRATVVCLTAIVAARFINWAIYTWAWNFRALGPWAPASGEQERDWRHHLPVLGWWLLRGESDTYGKRYWLRPMLIELAFPAAITWYYFRFVTGAMLPDAFAMVPMPPDVSLELHTRFLGHFVLFALMAIATFIDFDEQSIPDYVTVPGTIIGLLGAALAPAWLPIHPNLAPLQVLELDAATPLAWPDWLNSGKGLLLGLGILAVWGFALLDRRWITRRGQSKAIQYFFARMFRVRRLWLTIICVTLALMVLTAVYWSLSGGGWRWPYLLSSLLGLAFAGGVTWGVRFSASVGLGVEALGFGDVTLMAMIGTYIGWQPSLIVFFLAPLIAILFVLVRAILTGETATPYGPYLCAAVVALLVMWNELWFLWAAPLFKLGGVIVGIVVGCVGLMGVMLWIWRLIKQAVGLAAN